jgi:hypothetical protein
MTPLTVRQSQMQQMADATPGTRVVCPCPERATWIEVRLVDEHDDPFPGERCRIRLPDSSTMEGFLDQEGKVRFEGIVPGQTVITFPDLDAKEWKPK